MCSGSRDLGIAPTSHHASRRNTVIAIDFIRDPPVAGSAPWIDQQWIAAGAWAYLLDIRRKGGGADAAPPDYWKSNS